MVTSSARRGETYKTERRRNEITNKERTREGKRGKGGILIERAGGPIEVRTRVKDFLAPAS